MTKPREDTALFLALANQLASTLRVQRLAQSTADSVDNIASEAALGLVDIAQSCHVLQELGQKLAHLAPGSTEIEDVLDDVAEEYRHIHYHIVHTRLFNYVVPQA